jgi:hypothetical protein
MTGLSISIPNAEEHHNKTQAPHGADVSGARIGRAWSGPWRGRTLVERFEQKFIPEPNSGCWLWIGSLTHDGYGRIKVNGKSRSAQRVAHRIYKGTIPDGMEIDHKCHVTCCVNPDHLEAVTPIVNFERSRNAARANMLKQECAKGHPLSGDNLYVSRVGHRGCRICRLAAKRRHRERCRA